MKCSQIGPKAGHLLLVLAILTLEGCEGCGGTEGPVFGSPTVAPFDPLEISPERLDFGIIPVVKQDALTFSLTNRKQSSYSLRVSLSDGTSSAFSLEAPEEPAPDSIEGEGILSYTVSCAPTSDGVLTGEVSIYVYDSSREMTYSVSLTAEGSTDPDDFDADEDGISTNEGDCDDADALVYPDAPEVCNGKDDDCDQRVDEAQTLYLDLDEDGYGDAAAQLSSCLLPSQVSTNDDDCDDADASRHPGGKETCNLVDDDCDGVVDEGSTKPAYRDRDGDGYGDDHTLAYACTVPVGFVSRSGDCDDTSAKVNPGMEEVCDGLDNNCLEGVDEVVDAVLPDRDGDGFGEGTAVFRLCTETPGFVPVDPNGDGKSEADCDDTDGLRYPGAEEVCDGVDNDCDNAEDEGLLQTFYVDEDGDGFGQLEAVSEPILACSRPEGTSERSEDCNDAEPLIYPGALEACDATDNDCDKIIDESGAIYLFRDSDGDGHGDAGWSTVQCVVNLDALGTWVPSSDDCDDFDEEVYAGAVETCNGVDDNCDGSVDEGVLIDWYWDEDGDGFGGSSGKTVGCVAPSSSRTYAPNHDDCDDASSLTYPGALEHCDGEDEDCDGGVDETSLKIYLHDTDGDGYGRSGEATLACAASGATVPGDCDDASAAVYPSAKELCDDVDNDCDGYIDSTLKDERVSLTTTYYRDQDGDGYAGSDEWVGCSPPTGYAESQTDCDDGDASRYPDALEVCDSRDSDCDGRIDVTAAGESEKSIFYLDVDGDGHGSGAIPVMACESGGVVSEAGDDCEDRDPLISPSASELCNELDDDCDGLVDPPTISYADSDGDGYGDPATYMSSPCGTAVGDVSSGDDCNDQDDTVHPGALEVCDGVDRDCDGSGFLPPAVPELASNSPLCAGDTLLLMATTDEGALATWSGPGGYTAQGNVVEIEGVLPALAGEWSARASSDGCTSDSATLWVEVNSCAF